MLLWAALSIGLVILLPIGLGTLYVVAMLVLLWWWQRRDAAHRRAELADADDTLRAGDAARSVRGPSGRGYGGHSWTRRPD